MIEPVMRFNLSAAEGKFAELAHVVGASGGLGFLRWLADLKRAIGVAPSLSAVGVRPDHIAPMVDIAEKDICHHTNPRPCTRADFTRFFEEAL
jgi:alcohol dehydrogenase class IV